VLLVAVVLPQLYMVPVVAVLVVCVQLLRLLVVAVL
jgi:hypothetical protein